MILWYRRKPSSPNDPMLHVPMSRECGGGGSILPLPLFPHLIIVQYWSSSHGSLSSSQTIIPFPLSLTFLPQTIIVWLALYWKKKRIKLLTFFQNQFFPSERGVHCQFTIVQSNIYNMTGISILLHPDMNNDIIQHWTTKATQPNTKPHLWAKILSAEFGRVLKKLGTVNRFKIDDGWNKQNWNKWSNGARIIQI